jgi:neutral ceramidase
VLDNQHTKAILLGVDVVMLLEGTYAELAQQIIGPNLDGPSDKTVAVVEFESLSGELIAVYINYAMHANLMFMRNEISGGFPGATSRYIEEVYDEQAVAIWTVGAAGDQNPLYMRLAEPAIALQKRPQFAAAGGDPTNVIALANYQDATLDPKTLRLGAMFVDSIGQLLGIDQIALVAVTGELYNIIAQHLKKATPYGKTVVVTIANGKSVGYIPDDASYERHTFQVLGCRIKKGCAEKAIISTALDMMDQSMLD